MKQLSDKQKLTLETIIQCMELRGFPPTVRELAPFLGVTSTSTVQAYLKQLEEKGYIRRDPTKPRAIEILYNPDGSFRQPAEEIKASSCIQIPVIGNVAAGMPILAEQNIDSYCPVPKEFGSADELYMLKIRGNSMEKIGIYDGDRVIVEKTNTAEDGDIVVALVEDSATVKRFFKENGRYRLQPENDEMEPIYVSNVIIQGIVVGVLRNMKKQTGRW